MKKIKKLFALLLTVVTIVSSSSIPAFAYSASSTTPSTGQPWLGYVKASALNVRSTASTSGTVVSSFAQSSYVHIIEKSGNWYKVYYKMDGSTGYVSADYITIYGREYARTSASVNLRESASTTSNIKALVPSGTAVPYRWKSGTWYYVLFRTYQGYIHSDYANY